MLVMKKKLAILQFFTSFEKFIKDTCNNLFFASLEKAMGNTCNQSKPSLLFAMKAKDFQTTRVLLLVLKSLFCVISIQE